MLRPEQMSKVSVTGTKGVVEDVIEVSHEQNVVHLTGYRGDFPGFDTGSPLEGANEAAEKLVTVRSLLSILDVSPADAGSARIVTDEALETELEAVRTEVNELDDRRNAVEDDLSTVAERIERAEPFVDLGIDLELLSGYDNLEVAVGEADQDAVEHALADESDVARYETFAGDETDIVAAFVYPAEGATDVLDDALAGVEFLTIEVPDAEGEPGEYLDRLERRQRKLESRRKGIESELETLGLEHAGFLFAAEEELRIAVEKAEAPLQFATTEHAFVAEGWVPSAEYSAFATAVKDAVGDRVEVEELERAEYTQDRDVAGAGFAPAEGEVNREQEPRATTDGGQPVSDPPVVQNNPWFAEPFEVLVRTINRPNYHEIDPTIVLFLTFPGFFGFMIGDVGYGVVYGLLGYWLYSRFDSGGLRSLGFVAMISGFATLCFGVLYGEVFGMHLIANTLWGGHPLLHRGLEPGLKEWAQLWLLASVVVALFHLTVGYVFDFVKQLDHGLKAAVLESGSLVVVMLGIWLWAFSKPGNVQPSWMFTVLNGSPVPFGFSGFPPIAGAIGLWAIPVGLVLAYLGGGFIEAYEGLVNSLTHVLSYTRLGAEVLAEGGIAFVVNLLFFGAYMEHGEFHLLVSQTAQQALASHPEATVMFPGLMHAGVVGVLAGLVVLVLGHLLVLALGITSAGMQAVRLEYVEFFGKFYEGGGEKYEPFGHQRTYTTQD